GGGHTRFSRDWSSDVCSSDLEVDQLDPDLVLMFAEQLLRVIGAVEVLALAVLARPGMVAADDHVGAAVVAADDAVPDRLTRAARSEERRGGQGGRCRGAASRG